MKKQYLISLLGIAAISAPLGNSLLSANPKGISPAYDVTSSVSGLTISDDSNVKVLNLDGGDTPAAGDTIKSIDLILSYDANSVKNFEVDSKALETDGLNVYTSNDVDNDETTDVEPIIEKSYNELQELGDPNLDGNSLTISKDASNDSDLAKIWKYELKDDSKNFVVTADGLSTEGDNSGDKVEGSVGEIDISLSAQKPGIEITSDIVTTTNHQEASVDYKISGIDDNGKPIGIESLEWVDANEENSFKTNIDPEAIAREGTIIASELKPQSYDGTKLVLTPEGSGGPIIAPVDSFEIDEKDFKEPTLTFDYDSSTVDSATFIYEVDYGMANEGDLDLVAYNLSKDDVLITDDQGTKKVFKTESKGLGDRKQYKATINGLESGTKYSDLKVTATFKENKATGSDTYEKVAVVESSINEFTTIASAPEFSQNDYEAYIIDTENDILEAKGTIDTHGSQIEKITFMKMINGTLREVTTEYTEDFVIEDNILNYDIWTDTYDAKTSNGINDYQIMVSYKINPSDTDTETEKYILSDENVTDKVTEDDLSYLIKGDDSTGIGAGAIIGIIVGALLLVGIVAFVGNLLYKKYKISKA